MGQTEIARTDAASWGLAKDLIGDTAIRIVAGFADNRGALATLPSSPLPTLTITYLRTGLPVVSDAMMSKSGMPQGQAFWEGVAGLWEMGNYQFKATATLTGTPNYPTYLEGMFEVLGVTPEIDMAMRVKNYLSDLEPEMYRLDLPVPKWNLQEIIQQLQAGVADLNFSGPINTHYDLTNCPRFDLLVIYAAAKVVKSKALLENWSPMQMADGPVNLTINRAPFMDAWANSQLTFYQQQLKDWKRSIRPRLRSLGTNQYPFQLRRAIGFLPNMKQVFG